MMNPLLRKIGVKEGMRSVILDLPPGLAGAFEGLPSRNASGLSGSFDYIHLYARTRMDFQEAFPKAKKHLEPGGMLWVSWPKGGGPSAELNIKEVIRMGYDFGMVESKCISLDPVWSALKFTFPKPGKEYRNSYGKLE
jgi:hypothetical protein